MKQRLALLTFAVRLLLTVALLFFVWTNAHWSVALLLTLLTVHVEGIVIMLERKPPHV
jgi:hypothetical protein